jgi:hypothetical protein
LTRRATANWAFVWHLRCSQTAIEESRSTIPEILAGKQCSADNTPIKGPPEFSKCQQLQIVE